MTIADFATVIMALGTVGSFVYIARQVRVQRQQAKGQFILALDAQFEKTNDITKRLVNGQTYVPEGHDWMLVFALMSVFERINIMFEDKILDIGLIDRLYGFRVVSIIANDAIYQRLASTGAEWQDFIDLCYALAHHRRKRSSQSDKAFIERVYKLNKTYNRIPNPFSF